MSANSRVADVEHLAAARRQRGLSQKDLAARLGISLWTLDQLERGRGGASMEERARAVLGARQVPTLPRGREENDLELDVADEDRPARSARYVTGGRDLVLASIVLLVVVRFFTEVVSVLPRAANFVDIPILFALGIAAAARPDSALRSRSLSFGLPALLFLLLCVASIVVNPTRVAAGPALVFIYGFLAPIIVYAAVMRLWTPGQAHTLSRLLVALGVLQLFVVYAIDLPLFLASGDPDVVSGTFGTNAYQLVFFLLLFTSVVAAIFVTEKERLTARFAPVVFVLTLGAIFLAQYRALLVTTAVSILLIGALLGPRGRGIVAGAFITASFVLALSYVSANFPGLRFSSTVASIGESPEFYVSERLRSIGTFLQLYTDEPVAVLTGSGPGTFSSRGWQTFANAGSTSRSNVAGSYALALTGGSAYRTDVSDRYVRSQLRTGQVVEGSRALTSPYSSYSSLLAEVGLLGFLLIVGIYVRALMHAMRMTLRALRERTEGDSLPGLVLAATIAFTVLLQMAFLENWLEVTRVTFLAWAILAVATKEFHARKEASE